MSRVHDLRACVMPASPRTAAYCDSIIKAHRLADRDAGIRFQQILQRAAEPTEISADVMAAAVRLWLEYFRPHARPVEKR
jgi:hypothetical protein